MAGTDPAFPRPGTGPLTAPPEAKSVVVDGADPLLGLNLSGFRVTRLLASGGMGLVYLAEHETIGRRAAVKVLKPEVADDTEWTRRFLTEARALASLKHRNVIEVLNFGATPDGRQYLMMEFLEGESLDVHIRRVGALSAPVALGIADQVLNGLAEAHKKGVVHRDLKPSNVFLLREHNGELLVKVIDFGLARQEPISLVDAPLVLPQSSDGASLLAGTPEYIAPEQAQGFKVDGSADLYSLGVMLFEMLSGQLPFESASVAQLLQKHLSQAPPRLSSTVANLTEGIEEFVESLLEKDPLRRPASADVARVAVNRLLRKLASDSTAVRMAPTAPKNAPTLKIERPTVPAALTDESLEKAFPGRRARRRRNTLVALLVLLLLMLFGGGLWRWTRVEPTPLAAVQPTVVAPAPAPAVAPPAPEPSLAVIAPPEDEEELTPIPTNITPAVAKPPVAKRANPPRFVVDAANCVPTDDWRVSIKNELSVLGSFVSSDEKKYTLFQSYEERIGKIYPHASSGGECAEVAKLVNELQSALGVER